MEITKRLLMATLLGILVFMACREISPEMTTEELRLSKVWGKPRDSISIRDTTYEIWWYVSSYIDNLIFIRNGRVISHKKYSPSENVWDSVKTWVLYAERDRIYQQQMDEHIDDLLNARLREGMIPEEVRLSWGAPKEIRTYSSQYGARQEWLYQKQPYQTTRLVFTNERLTEIGTE